MRRRRQQSIRRFDEAEPDRHADQQRQRRRLRGDRQKRVHLGAGPFEHVGAPEMERHGRELERQPDHHHQPAEHQHHLAVADRAVLAEACGQLVGHRRQVARAEHAGQQADAVEHDAGRARAVDRVFQRRLAALAPPFEHAGQRIGRHARHFDAQEDRQQVIGRGHDAHAERRPEHERVEVRGVFAIGNAREPREHDEQHREEHQQAAEE